jgi:hypothetical protein
MLPTRRVGVGCWPVPVRAKPSVSMAQGLYSWPCHQIESCLRVAVKAPDLVAQLGQVQLKELHQLARLQALDVCCDHGRGASLNVTESV